MPEALIVEFTGATEADDDAVHQHLSLDRQTGERPGA